MANKTLIRLLITLVILGGIALVLHYAGGGAVSTVDSSTTKKKVFAEFPINDVAKVVITEKDGSITLTKGENAWQVAERDNYKADTTPIAALLKEIWDLNIIQPITIGRTQYGRLNLLDPSASDTKPEEAATLLSFQDKDGKDLASLWLGKVYERSEGRPDPFGGGMAKTDAGRYVKRGDGNSVYLVGETFSSVKTEASDWIDKSFFRVEKIKSIEIVTATKTDDWKLERANESDDFVLAKANSKEALDSTKVSSMKSAFSNPQIEDVFIGEEAKEQKTDQATFKILTFDDFSYEISVGEKNDLNELPLTLKVSAKLPKERKAGEEESDEEKERLDKEFADSLAELQNKLDQEKALEGHVFKVRSYIVDSIIKKRSELLEQKDEDEASTSGEIAPGVSLPGLPAPAPKAEVKPAAPKAEAKPKEAKPAPKAEAKAEDAKPAPKTETKAEDAKPAPKAEAKAEDAKPAPKAEAKAEDAKPAPKAEAKAEDAKPAPKAEAKAEDAKPAPKPEAKAEDAKPAPKAEAKAEDAKPAPKAEAKAESANQDQ